MKRLPQRLPVRIGFAAADGRGDGWGRLLALSAGRAQLETGDRLAAGDRLVLWFELAGERYDEFYAEVFRAERDADGTWSAELRWLDPIMRRRLARALLAVLSSP